MIITIIDSIFNLTLFTKFLAFYSLPAPDSVLKWHYELSERITKMREIALITGASSGIGRETALYFSQKGHPVIIICNKNTEGLNELKSLIKGNNGIVESFIADVSSYEEMSDIFNILSQKNFLPDILVNNAGISHIGLLQDMTSDEWKHIIDVNLTSVFNCSKLIIPHMLSKKSGHIINISSMWGNVGASCEVAYSASKGGVNTFTKALARELAPSNIAVNAIAFGTVDTRMNHFLDAEEKAALIEEIPAGRFLDPQESAEIIYSVATLNPYVTGQIITADGGLT